MPELSCVQGVLELESSIGEVRVEDFGGSRRVTWRGLAPPNSVPTFFYKIDQRELWLQFTIDQDRPVRVTHGVRTPKDTPASALVALQSQLDAVEAAVASQCGVLELVSVLEETCRGEHCDDIDTHAAQQGVAADVQTPSRFAP